MRHVARFGICALVISVATGLAVGEARADTDVDVDVNIGGDRDRGRNDDEGYRFGLALTIGEGMYFFEDDIYRGPVSLEVVPSFGWIWFKLDLGLSTTLESVRIGGSDLGEWRFTFRPGGRLTPPMIPLYFRLAFPLELYTQHFDWGVLLGLGLDFPLTDFFGLVFEVDTTLTNDLEWGGRGVPLEFRLGVSFAF